MVVALEEHMLVAVKEVAKQEQRELEFLVFSSH